MTNLVGTFGGIGALMWMLWKAWQQVLPLLTRVAETHMDSVKVTSETSRSNAEKLATVERRLQSIEKDVRAIAEELRAPGV